MAHTRTVAHDVGDGEHPDAAQSLLAEFRSGPFIRELAVGVVERAGPLYFPPVVSRLAGAQAPWNVSVVCRR